MNRLTSLHRSMISFWLVALLFSACQSVKPTPTSPVIKVIAAESFLADIASQVTGNRWSVESLIPAGIDPHAFEPSPRDVAMIADSQVLIVNGGGLETWLERILSNANPSLVVIEASAGLTSRSPQPGEPAHDEEGGDPHFWLDPLLVIQYVDHIRLGLTQVDPPGADVYNQNAQAYIAQLKELDAWIKAQVEQIPPERRLLVTNHENFGYFADRYGFKVVGTIIPSVSTGASPSAQELAGLVEQIKRTHTPAIFLETGANPALANQVAAETGIKVITNLYTHSITEPTGDAPSYIAMMKYNVSLIAEALK